jgi:prepilin-type N-terminal cleavage/methylation domain-containing protein
MGFGCFRKNYRVRDRGKIMREAGKAFTLIELLIVVAIISILAAIAVPNFLDAHTRASVAKTKADMRSIVTAIVSYEVDHNDVLTYWTEPDQRGPQMSFFLKTDWTTGGTGWVNPSIGVFLTTPISYMSDIPWDHFNTRAWTTPPGKHSSVMMHSKSHTLEAFMLPPGWRWHWALESAGPNGMWWQDVEGESGSIIDYLFYDPTNGTISAGDIWYHDTWAFGTGWGAPDMSGVPAP